MVAIAFCVACEDTATAATAAVAVIIILAVNKKISFVSKLIYESFSKRLF